MTTLASVYFNAALRGLHPSKSLQLNPIKISITRTYIYSSDINTKPLQIEDRHHTFIDNIPINGSQRQVFLVEIQTKHISQQPNGEQISQSNQHFNLVILDGKNVYLFEPLVNSNQYGPQIARVIAAQFPNHRFSGVGVHPQTSQKKDVFCMAYVCMLADAVLHDINNDNNILEIANHTFRKWTVTTFLKQLNEKVKKLPPMPEGADEPGMRAHPDNKNWLIPQIGYDENNQFNTDWLTLRTTYAKPFLSSSN